MPKVFYKFQKDTFKFNKRGHLPTNYTISFEDFEDNFVKKMSFYKRPLIFEEFKEYINGIAPIIQQEKIMLWVNGSFVTDETEPKDIDFVIFIKKETVNLLKYLYEFNKKFIYMDAYFVCLDDDVDTYKDLVLYWNYQFSRSRDLYKKGFLKLKLKIDNGLISNF